MSRRSIVTLLAAWPLVISLLCLSVADASAQLRGSSTRTPPATAPSVGAPARSPSFWLPWESQGVPITNRPTPPCDADECRLTMLVGEGSIYPKLYTKYTQLGSASGRANAWVIKCEPNPSEPSMPDRTWNPRAVDSYQPLDADTLRLRPSSDPFRLWFKPTLSGRGTGSQCFRVVRP
jgi:hypothetical protein